MIRAGSEEQLHQQVCDYLKLQYPGVMFHSDFGSGVRLTMGQAAKQKRLQSSRAWPDLFIAERRNGKSGLFLELKREGTRLTLKNGTFTTDAHLNEQKVVLEQLENRGFDAQFAVGFADTKQKIDTYLSHV